MNDGMTVISEKMCRMEARRAAGFLLFAAMSLAVFAVRPADRQARVDGQGVMRWVDDGSEVSVFGVNYYAPFYLEYKKLKDRGCDIKATISRDVAHFRRLGLSAVRLHCFDREISSREGAFLDNDHADALDWLISECASNGIYTILTPISSWGGYGTNGFSRIADMRTLASDMTLRKAAARFECEFAMHVNRYTARRYAEDASVLCFELINEPRYFAGTTGEQVAQFANELYDGIRRSATKKPVFYSATWNKRNDCVPMLKTEGVSGVYYPTGLRASRVLSSTQLHRVQGSSIAADARLEGKAKLIYEFDAADTPGAYMYPAMARLFRSEGAQSATQFQYDPAPLSGDNISFKTHYLNLIYTPAKAMSMAIAAEVFRRLPRGAQFKPSDNEMIFAPFGINAASNLSWMVTERDLIHTASTSVKVPNPSELRRVWGCGMSQVAGSTGNGCYFLDRVCEGVWRLQLFPSVMNCEDPYSGLPGKKTIVLADRPELTIRLPGLGAGFSAWRSKDALRIATAKENRIVLEAGDYILFSGRSLSNEKYAMAMAMDIPEWWAPPPDAPDPKLRKWPRSLSELAAEGRAKYASPRDWNFFDPVRAVMCGVNGGRTSSVKADRNFRACRYWFKDFIQHETVSISVPSSGKVYAAAFPKAGSGETLIVTARSATKDPERVELALKLDNAQVWGVNVTLTEHWSDIRIPLSSIRYFSHWNVPKFRKDFRLDIRRLDYICLTAGKWLDPSAVGREHVFEIAAMRVE
jgi:hypothetical protein